MLNIYKKKEVKLVFYQIIRFSWLMLVEKAKLNLEKGDI